MKKSTAALVAILYLTSIAVYAQSLGDLAREEQNRRDAISSSILIILESAPAPVNDEEVSADEAKDNDASAKTATTQNDDAEESEDLSDNDDPDEYTDLYGNTESYWRNTISESRDRLNQLENDTRRLTSQRNTLQLQYDRTNTARRGPIKNELDRIKQELENNRKNMEQSRKELQFLQREARSSGALPGWLE
jgi:hypothetical protein